ncbi:hypothetical protein OC845_001586 [Tilletia horrida]|nr:hypothetical protein OC845_001586 [Tilletia horrida]
MHSQHQQAQQQQQQQAQHQQLQLQQQQRQLHQQLQLQALADYQQVQGVPIGLSQHQAFNGLTVGNSGNRPFGTPASSANPPSAGQIVPQPGMYAGNVPMSQPFAINVPALNNNVHHLANPRQVAAAAAAAATTANPHAKAGRWPFANAVPSSGSPFAQSFFIAGNSTALQPGPAAGPSYVPSSQPNSPSNSPRPDTTNPDQYTPHVQYQSLAPAQSQQPAQYAQLPQNHHFTVAHSNSTFAPQQPQAFSAQHGNHQGSNNFGNMQLRNPSPERFNGLGTQNAPIDLTDDFDANEVFQNSEFQAQQQRQQQQLQLQQLQQQQQQQQHQYQLQNAQQHQPQFHPQPQTVRNQQYGLISAPQFHLKSERTENVDSPGSVDSLDPQAERYLLREPVGQQVDVLISPVRREVTDSFDIVSNASFEDHLKALKAEEPLQNSAQLLQQQYANFQHLYAHAGPSGSFDPGQAGPSREPLASELFPDLFNLRQDFCERFPKPAAEIAIKSLCGIRGSPEAEVLNRRGSEADTASEVRDMTPAQRREVLQKLRSIGNRTFWRHWLDDKRGKVDILYSWIRSLVPHANSEQDGEWTGELYYPDAVELFLLLEDLPMQADDLDKKDPLCKAMRKLIAARTSISARARDVSRHWIDKANGERSPEPSSKPAAGQKRKADVSVDDDSVGAEAADHARVNKQATFADDGDSDSDDNQPLTRISKQTKPKPKPINGISTKDKLSTANGTGLTSPTAEKKVPPASDTKEGPPASKVASGGAPAVKKKKTALNVDLAAEKARLQELLNVVRAKKKEKIEGTENTTLSKSGDQSKTPGTASVAKPKALVTTKVPGAAGGPKVATTLLSAKKAVMPAVPKKAVSSTSSGMGLNFFGASATSAAKPRPGTSVAASATAKKPASSGPNKSKGVGPGSKAAASAGTSLIMDLLSDERGPKKGGSGAAGRRGLSKAEKEKEKKRVKWKEDEELVSVKIVERYLDVDEALHENIVEGGANGLMLQEASMFKSQRSMTEELDWYEPIPLALPDLALPVPGADSTMRSGEAGVWPEEEDIDGSAMDVPGSLNLRIRGIAKARTPVSPESAVVDLPPLEKKDPPSGSDGQADDTKVQPAAPARDEPRVEIQMTIGAELEPFVFHDGPSTKRTSANGRPIMSDQQMQVEGHPQSGQTSANGDPGLANALAGAFSLDNLGIDFSQVQHMLSGTGDQVPGVGPGAALAHGGYLPNTMGLDGQIAPTASEPYANGGEPTYDPRPRPHVGGFNPHPYAAAPPQGHMPGPGGFQGPEYGSNARGHFDQHGPGQFRGPPSGGPKPTGKQPPVACIYWKRGNCHKGAACTFRHDR